MHVLSLLSDPEHVYPDTQIGLSEDEGGLQWERIKITEVNLFMCTTCTNIHVVEVCFEF